MMVMMVVMMPRVRVYLYVAMLLVAMLALALQLQRHVTDAVLGKLLAYRVKNQPAVFGVAFFALTRTLEKSFDI